MSDILMVALLGVAFAALAGFVRACDGLTRRGGPDRDAAN
jgi:hypothetical protein